MSSNNDSSADVPIEGLTALAIEHWRLVRWLDELPVNQATAQPRSALGRMADALRKCGMETRSFEGHPFDPGLALRVLDVVESEKLVEGQAFVLETVSPQVLLRGSVIRQADVVTVRGTKH